MSHDTQTIQERVWRWLDDAVIGLNLCPFAAAPRRKGNVILHVSDATNAQDAIEHTIDAAEELLDLPGKTTLVVLPHALTNFHTYLDALETLEAQMDEAGYPGWLQVASFHPDYRFEGAPVDDPAHHTNRAPYPIFHLLHEDEMTEVLQRHPDAEGIPTRNVERLRAMSPEDLQALWASW